MAEPRRSAANDAPDRDASDLKGARILVVEARFYEDIADALLAGATRALQEAGATFERVSVPGSLEGRARFLQRTRGAGKQGVGDVLVEARLDDEDARAVEIA